MLKGIVKTLWKITKLYFKANNLAWALIGIGAFIKYAEQSWPMYSMMELMSNFYDVAISGWKIIFTKSEEEA